MDKIRILGVDWGFRYDKSLARIHGNKGEARFQVPEIVIDSTFTKQQQSSTIIHEIIEVINNDLELKLDHPTISQLEAGLNQVFQDNPGLRDKIFLKRGKK